MRYNSKEKVGKFFNEQWDGTTSMTVEKRLTHFFILPTDKKRVHMELSKSKIFFLQDIIKQLKKKFYIDISHDFCAEMRKIEIKKLDEFNEELNHYYKQLETMGVKE